jgi:hypothetical protein
MPTVADTKFVPLAKDARRCSALSSVCGTPERSLLRPQAAGNAGILNPFTNMDIV